MITEPQKVREAFAGKVAMIGGMDQFNVLTTGTADEIRAEVRRLFDGFGGMLSFELAGGAEAARRFMEEVTIPIVAPSLGGVETLITLPAATSHAGLTPEERLEVGVADGLIRVSVGIEGTEDLVEDFEAALAAL